MKKIAHDKGNLDTSRDYVYTAWDGVKRFSENFLELLTSRTGILPRASGGSERTAGSL